MNHFWRTNVIYWLVGSNVRFSLKRYILSFYLARGTQTIHLSFGQSVCDSSFVWLQNKMNAPSGHESSAGKVCGACNETRLAKTQAILEENWSRFCPVPCFFNVFSLPTGLALIMKRLLTKYDNLFEVSFPYSMGWHGKRMHLIILQSWGGGVFFPKCEVLPFVLFPWRTIKNPFRSVSHGIASGSTLHMSSVPYGLRKDGTDMRIWWYFR